MPSNHYHDAYEILYLVSGELYYFIEDRTFQIVSGVLLFINANDLHRLINVNGTMYERVTLLFKREFLRDFLRTALFHVTSSPAFTPDQMRSS